MNVVPPYFTVCSHIQPHQVRKAKSLSLYCGMDNEYQISPEPTPITIVSVAKLRGHCSDFFFYSFSATGALFEKMKILLFPINVFLLYHEIKFIIRIVF